MAAINVRLSAGPMLPLIRALLSAPKGTQRGEADKKEEMLARAWADMQVWLCMHVCVCVSDYVHVTCIHACMDIQDMNNGHGVRCTGAARTHGDA